MRGIIIIILLFSFGLSYGQTLKQYVKAADKSMVEKDYYSAMKYYQNALEIKENDAALHYKCADAARQFFAFELANIHFNKAQKLSKKGEFPLLNLYWAEVKQTLGEYLKAEKLYQAYFKAGIGSEMNLEKADMEADACQWAAEQQINSDVKIKRLSKKINSKFSEFAGSWLSDTLIFASLKYKDETVAKDRKISKILLSNNTEVQRGKSVRIKGIPENKNIANATFDHKRNTMYFTICDYINTVDLNCDIYYSINDGKRWIAEKLPEPINVEGFTNTQPAWSDIEGWKGLFFTSNRPEGKGGKDIWFAKYKAADRFEEPINITAVNTPFDDITPSIDNTNPNSPLYFSSNGRKGFGNFDVYFSEKGKEWGIPQNMGRPVNTGYNDVYFWKDTKNEKAIVSSNRPESTSMLKDDPACCNDLYEIIFPEEEIVVINDIPKPEPKPIKTPTPILSTPIPQPKPEPSKPVVNNIPTPKPAPQPKPIIIPTPKPNYYPSTTPVVSIESILPVKVYFDNDEPDKRTTNTRTIKSYSTSFREYLQREPIFFDKYLKGISNAKVSEEESKLISFFTNDVKRGFDDLELLSRLIQDKLANGQFLTIEIKGYTSPRAKTKYNEYLAQRRTSSLLNYFNQYNNGAFKTFFSSGQLKIVELPIGEIMAPSGISDVISDERNSIYSPEASKERRAEVVAVKIN